MSVVLENITENDRSVFADARLVSGSGRPTFLESFQERELGLDVSDNVDEAYRFFWLRTFHNPIMIKMFASAGEHWITVKEMNGLSGYELGSIGSERTTRIEVSQWCELIMLLEAADFWNMKKVEFNSLAHDGAMWNLEGWREKRYYTGGEQSPVGGPFYEVCRYMMQLAGIAAKPGDLDFY